MPEIGQEGFTVSHEGGELKLYDEISEIFITGIRRRTDTRDRSDRLIKAAAAWAPQYDDLTTAYLDFQHDPLDPQPDESPEPSCEQDGDFTLLANDALQKNIATYQCCIGCAPTIPSVAITIRTLAVYRQTHRVCPRLSIFAEVKKLCHMHNVPYHRYLTEQFRVAYDTYLEVQRRVDSRINAALGHDTPNWRMLNSCPACQYKCEDEPKLRYSCLCAIDGNNSLKLVDSAIRRGVERIDPRDARSDIWLKEEEVDVFKDEVRRSHVGSNATPDSGELWADVPDDATPDDDPDVSPPTDMDPDSAEPTDVCINRWRNASPEARKKMFAIFKKSGVFVCVCRHGMLLTICDMIRSGEL
ncbi:hypothetical protein BJ138DRAFT_1138811 [Hygrophoropsis aurantiaca]|uniref:Uncharacterized protein n=1 Tax=Hygrophoropsis aurantiaca TaxID=72124 RepID=A0ACB7ZNZ9_9AGAM|nr:hypothetical protein BJ138DRAFT_1138811 [Hygrophoropsis aurantiaca]